MKLQALLSRFELDHELIEKSGGKFHYKSVDFFERTEDFPGLRLGIEKLDRTFISQSHFRGYDMGGDFYVLTFRLLELDDSTLPSDYRIKVRAKKDSEERELKYDAQQNIYYDPPLLERDKKTSTWKYSNSAEKAMLGSISPGMFYLNVYMNGIDSPINDEPYKVMVLPSGFTQEQFKQMLDDILAIRRELVIEQNAKQSIQTSWKYVLEDIGRVVDNIATPLWKINCKPRGKLEQTYVKKPVQQIRKYDARTLIEVLTNRSSGKVTATESTESIDIYEHQLMRYALYKLRGYCAAAEVDVKKSISERADDLDRRICKLLQEFGADNIAELKEIIEKFNRCYETKKKYIQWKLPRLQERTNPEDTVEVIIHIKKNTNVDSWEMQVLDNQLKLSPTKKKYVNYYDGGYQGNKDGVEYVSYETLNDHTTYSLKYKKVKLELLTADVKQHMLLYYAMSKTKKDIDLEIEAIVLKNNFYQSDPLRGKVKGKQDSFDDSYNLRIIELKRIGKVQVAKMEKMLRLPREDRTEIEVNAEDEIIKLFSKYGKIFLQEELLEQIKSYASKKDHLSLLIKGVKDSETVLANICQKLDRYLGYSFLSSATKKSVPWKLTQIFVNDKNYASFWSSLRNLDKNYEFTRQFHETDLLLKKTDELYEYWVLIRMVKWLKDTGWTIRGGQSFKTVIDEFLQEHRTRKSNRNEGLKICLEHKGRVKKMSDSNPVVQENNTSIGRIEMNLYYNTILHTISLIPDYAFEITVFNEDGEEWLAKKWFYLDAKYRCYDEQSGLDSLYNDLNKVAIDKYINNYRKHKCPSDGAFLVHTDSNDAYTYFGGYHTESTFKKLNQIEQVAGRNPQHQFGAFVCIPGHEKNLETFLKMLLEYHFIRQNVQYICWECGGIHTFVDPKPIYGGNYKFYVTCENPECGEFWVRNHCERSGHKLVKHQARNYHKEEYEGYPWYVKCPVCDLIEKEELFRSKYSNIWPSWD